MTTQSELVAAAKKRLRDIEEERSELFAVLRRYGELADGAPRQNGRAPQGRTSPRSRSRNKARHAAASRPKHKRSPFRRLEGGPTDAILSTLRSVPTGLRYAEVLAKAVPIVNTNADDPERSIGSVLQSLKKRGKVTYHNGLYFAASQ